MNNQTSILNDVEPAAVELTIDELDAVNGGFFSSMMWAKYAESAAKVINNLRQ